MKTLGKSINLKTEVQKLFSIQTPSKALKFFVLYFCLTSVFTYEASAQLNIPFPGVRGRTTNKPKSASDLLKEEEAKPKSKQQRPEDDSESMQNDFLGYYSHGWFPTPFPAQSLYLFSSLAWIINDANKITFSALPRINSPFSPVNPYSNDGDRKPRPRRTDAKDTARSGDYHNSEYNDVDIIYEIALPIPAMLRLGIGYAYQRGVLFAKDRSFNGLSSLGDGALVPLQEIHTIDMQEHFLKGTFGIKIPLYGAFVDMFDQRISSYYYLYLGAQAQYNVFNRAIQHAQLIQPGVDFIYGTRNNFSNGTDTIQVWNAPMPTLNTLRVQPEIAIGWGLSGEITATSFLSAGSFQIGLAAMMELFAVFPFQTVTTDTPWRQYVVGARVAIGWHRRLGQ